jgi:hypothetical protein
MKFRSALLFACMLVVPALAMFSHRVPADWRTAVRDAVSRTVASWTTGAPADPTPVAASAAAPASPALPAPRPVAPPVAATPLPPRPAPPVVGGGFRALPPPQPADDRDDARRELARLGALGIECRPLHGLHVASCSVALDASGQLLRVFQASGPDPDAATRTLLADVTAWRSRVAAGQPAAGDPRAGAARRF